MWISVSGREFVACVPIALNQPEVGEGVSVSDPVFGPLEAQPLSKRVWVETVSCTGDLAALIVSVVWLLNM